MGYWIPWPPSPDWRGRDELMLVLFCVVCFLLRSCLMTSFIFHLYHWSLFAFPTLLLPKLDYYNEAAMLRNRLKQHCKITICRKWSSRIHDNSTWSPDVNEYWPSKQRPDSAQQAWTWLHKHALTEGLRRKCDPITGNATSKAEVGVRATTSNTWDIRKDNTECGNTSNAVVCIHRLCFS